MIKRRQIDPDTLVQIYDLAEAIEDVIPKKVEATVVIHALVHVLARGGILVRGVMSKNEFIAGVVETLDINYRAIESARAGVEDKE